MDDAIAKGAPHKWAGLPIAAAFGIAALAQAQRPALQHVVRTSDNAHDGFAGDCDAVHGTVSAVGIVGDAAAHMLCLLWARSACASCQPTRPVERTRLTAENLAKLLCSDATFDLRLLGCWRLGHLLWCQTLQW